MAKRSRGYTSKRDKTEKAVIIILALVMLVVAIVMISKANNMEQQKTVGAFAFEIGGLDAQGNEIKDTSCIRLKKAINVDGLEIVLDEEADVKYVVYFFELNEDGEEVFLSATDVLDADLDASLIPEGAELCRIVVEPTMDAEVGVFEIEGYAGQLSISYNK
ncbi:MAG: hypothetical protein IJX23_01360 [Clostridia bacterium]|nr:hypothetical protein [Clostridia bacterium]